MSNILNETHLRTVGKSVSWRIVITMVHIINGFLVTGSWIFGVKIASFAAIVNIIMYWLHERGWNKVQWSREQRGNTWLEKWYRSLGKDVSWRIIITVNNFWIPWVLTGSWKIGLSFLTLATLVNMIIYWSHERVWNLIPYGKEVKQQLVQ